MSCHSWTGVRWWQDREANAEGRQSLPQIQGQEEFMAQGMHSLDTLHTRLELDTRVILDFNLRLNHIHMVPAPSVHEAWCKAVLYQ